MKRVIYTILVVLLLLALVPVTQAQDEAPTGCTILIEGETATMVVPHGTLDQSTANICNDGAWVTNTPVETEIEESPFLICGTWEESAPGEYEVIGSSSDGNIQRLLELDMIFRNDGPIAWARAVGLEWDGELCAVERQPEEGSFIVNMNDDNEENDIQRTLVTRIQFQTPTDEAVHAIWPATITTDWTNALGFDADGGAFQPDEANPSWTCTGCWLTEGEIPFTLLSGGGIENLWPENRTLPEWTED